MTDEIDFDRDVADDEIGFETTAQTLLSADKWQETNERRRRRPRGGVKHRLGKRSAKYLRMHEQNGTLQASVSVLLPSSVDSYSPSDTAVCMERPLLSSEGERRKRRQQLDEIMLQAGLEPPPKGFHDEEVLRRGYQRAFISSSAAPRPGLVDDADATLSMSPSDRDGISMRSEAQRQRKRAQERSRRKRRQEEKRLGIPPPGEQDFTVNSEARRKFQPAGSRRRQIQRASESSNFEPVIRRRYDGYSSPPIPLSSPHDYPESSRHKISSTTVPSSCTTLLHVSSNNAPRHRIPIQVGRKSWDETDHSSDALSMDSERGGTALNKEASPPTTVHSKGSNATLPETTARKIRVPYNGPMLVTQQHDERQEPVANNCMSSPYSYSRQDMMVHSPSTFVQRNEAVLPVKPNGNSPRSLRNNCIPTLAEHRRRLSEEQFRIRELELKTQILERELELTRVRAERAEGAACSGKPIPLMSIPTRATIAGKTAIRQAKVHHSRNPQVDNFHGGRPPSLLWF